MVKKYKDTQVETFITEITIDEKTYKRETFKPNLINYVYGKNGTGKTTISEFIQNSSSNYGTSIPRSNFELLVYNNSFIQDEIQSYGNIPGLFTITKQNAEVKKEIEKLEKEIADNNRQLAKLNEENDSIIKEKDNQQKMFFASTWKKTERTRKDYAVALTSAGTKQGVAKQVQQSKPVDHNDEDIKVLYDRSFGSDDDRYSYLKTLPVKSTVSNQLLVKPVISSVSTPFAEFLEEIKATDWVKMGHEQFQHTAGDKCPYCQQKLPHNFEEKLAECFDKSYQKQMDNLAQNAERFKFEVVSINNVLKYNSNIGFESSNMPEYEALCSALRSKLEAKCDSWDKKLKSPSSIILSKSDLSEELEQLNTCICKINEEIRKYNEIIDDRAASQKKCKSLIWEKMAYICNEDLVQYQAYVSTHDQRLKNIHDDIVYLTESNKIKEKEIQEKSKNVINTTQAMKDINQLIRDAGFQGFEIREKANAKYVYELVRDDGSVVKKLSEGERNFIGFLYFYGIVMNSRSDDGVQRNKVVVIDDPVSSMDSSALFSVATLTRHMIEICYNNYDMENEGPDFIKQIICLTHNPFFFKEISYNHITDYECANFYEITKDGNNQSHIKLFHKESGETGGKYINYSPIKNTYDALWSEYRTTTEPIILMNVIRRILEYYFLQIGGYKGNNIRTEVLDKNKDKFPNQWEYDAAASMIAYINTGAAGFDDGLYFDQSSISVDQMRSVCKNIFHVLNQDQHYDYMMR